MKHIYFSVQTLRIDAVNKCLILLFSKCVCFSLYMLFSVALSDQNMIILFYIITFDVMGFVRNNIPNLFYFLYVSGGGEWTICIVMIILNGLH